jgi:hypothetical protein
MRSLCQANTNNSGLSRNVKCFGVVVGLIIALSYTAVHAQITSCTGTLGTFDSGSTGVDGALDLSSVPAGTTILFDPESFNPPLDQDGDNVYHFTTITIPGGVTVRLSAEALGTAPVVWLASGAVQITGILDLSGQPGHCGGCTPIPAVAGAGGYGGGVGSKINLAAQPGNGPGGGQPTTGPGGGAGHAVAGGGGAGVGGAVYGNNFLIPLLGGSGGAGSWEGLNGSGGGAGGGALLIASSMWIAIGSPGAITADGGGGGCWVFSCGGGGSGGAIRLIAPTICGNGQIRASRNFTSFNNGSYGRIRMEAFQHAFTGFVDPAPHFVTPGLVFPPANAPSVRVVRIAGVDVPLNPTGSFIMPDVELDNASAVTLEIEARNIPPGTVVELTLTPETGQQQMAVSTPLAGTLQLSTATAVMTLPHGFSRFFVQANWTP